MSKANVATEEQKQTIIELFKKRETPIDPYTKWPEPFTEDDANSIIEILKGQVQLVNTIGKRNSYA